MSTTRSGKPGIGASPPRACAGRCGVALVAAGSRLHVAADAASQATPAPSTRRTRACRPIAGMAEGALAAGDGAAHRRAHRRQPAHRGAAHAQRDAGLQGCAVGQVARRHDRGRACCTRSRTPAGSPSSRARAAASAPTTGCCWTCAASNPITRGAAVPAATIEVTAKLLHVKDQKLAGSRTFLQAQPGATTAVPDVVAAFEQALAAISRRPRRLDAGHGRAARTHAQ